jgi:hypothetical protein
MICSACADNNGKAIGSTPATSYRGGWMSMVPVA